MDQTTPRSAKPSLSMMMFLQYAVWGVWLPYLANYLTASVDKGGLGFTGTQVGWILGLAGSIGAVSAPFVAGQVADRFLNAEKYLGLLLIAGGAVNFALAGVKDYTAFLALSILYSVLYMPTLALTNSVAFANLSNAEKQFPQVRTWGTIGWIVASNAFPLIWLQSNLQFTSVPPFLAGNPKPDATALIVDCLRVSGVISVLYGLWAMLMLPKTPPTRSEDSPLAVFKAFGLLKHPGFFIVTAAALPIAMIHNVYFMRTGPFLGASGFETAHIGPVMSIGQFSEIAVLAVLGLFIRRLGYRTVLAIGCVAFAARYGLFALCAPGGALASAADPKLVLAAAMLLHGVCYGFFFAGAFVYVEKVASADVRHSAQTVFGIIILGLGPVLAGLYNQWLDALAQPTPDKPLSWATLWTVQAVIGLACAVFVAAFFRPSLPAEQPAP
jgi:nucleoside transporter